jgi:group II intron reverse transcriptase/maturase
MKKKSYRTNYKMYIGPQLTASLAILLACFPDLTSPDFWPLAVCNALPYMTNEQNIYWKIQSRIHKDADGKCLNAFKILSDPEILHLAYESIKSTPGNMVKGTDEETLDGIDLEWFKKMSASLRKQEYRPRPARRIYIPKSNGKLRPLGISSPRDKIVQQAMRMVMEMILEEKFLPSSHGFRPGKGCHTALKTVRSWQGAIWFIEGDIKAFFDSIDHHILEKLICKHFRDPCLITLYWRLVKAGYIEWGKKEKKITPTSMGVPQGGIISPLLSNLVLHELDQWIENRRIAEAERCKDISPKRSNPAYNKITKVISKIKREDLNKEKTRGNKILRKLCKERLKLPRTIPNPTYSRIEYVRYADDWLIAIWGNKKRAQELKDQIHAFLSELKLDLSLEKTLITNARAEKANFLGVFIKRDASNISPPYTRRNRRGHRSRVNSSGILWITAPLKKITDRLTSKKFLEIKNNRWHPRPQSFLTTLPLKDIILWFRVILNGFLNFYSFVDNHTKLHLIYWILKECLRKTICQKKQYNKKEFLNSLGPDTTLNLRRRDGKRVTLDFKKPPLFREPNRFYCNTRNPDPLQKKNWKISTISALGMPCGNCGSSHNIEMHHIKHIKTINLKLSPFDQLAARVNRKQIPLCRSCHQQVHRGQHHGLSLKHFYTLKWKGHPKWSSFGALILRDMISSNQNQKKTHPILLHLRKPYQRIGRK